MAQIMTVKRAVTLKHMCPPLYGRFFPSLWKKVALGPNALRDDVITQSDHEEN